MSVANWYACCVMWGERVLYGLQALPSHVMASLCSYALNLDRSYLRVALDEPGHQIVLSRVSRAVGYG